MNTNQTIDSFTTDKVGTVLKVIIDGKEVTLNDDEYQEFPIVSLELDPDETENEPYFLDPPTKVKTDFVVDLADIDGANLREDYLNTFKLVEATANEALNKFPVYCAYGEMVNRESGDSETAWCYTTKHPEDLTGVASNDALWFYDGNDNVNYLPKTTSVSNYSVSYSEATNDWTISFTVLSEDEEHLDFTFKYSNTGYAAGQTCGVYFMDSDHLFNLTEYPFIGGNS